MSPWVLATYNACVVFDSIRLSIQQRDSAQYIHNSHRVLDTLYHSHSLSLINVLTTGRWRPVQKFGEIKRLVLKTWKLCYFFFFFHSFIIFLLVLGILMFTYFLWYLGLFSFSFTRYMFIVYLFICFVSLLCFLSSFVHNAFFVYIVMLMCS